MRAWLSVGLAAALALGILTLAVLVPSVVDGSAQEDDGEALVVGGPGVRRGEAPAPDGGVGLDDVETGDYVVGRHTEDDVEYDESPAMGGAHDPAWHACGAYDEPVREENVVHALEHGTVWIAYDPELSAGDVEALEDVLPEEGILAPYPDLRSPVVVTVWNRQLALSGADDPGLAAFIEEFGDGATSPEPFASCMGGLERSEGEGTGEGV